MSLPAVRLEAEAIDTVLKRRRYSPKGGSVHLQVMSAQPTTVRAPVLDKETAGPKIGAVQSQQGGQAAEHDQEARQAVGDQNLPNIVDPRTAGAARKEPLRAGPQVAEQSQEGSTRLDELETVRATEQERTVMMTQVQELRGRGNAVSPVQSSGFFSMSPQSPRRARTAARPDAGQPHEAERTVPCSTHTKQRSQANPGYGGSRDLRSFCGQRLCGRTGFRVGCWKV